MVDSGPHPRQGIPRNPHARGNLVRCLKSNPINVFRQQIRILSDNRNRLLSIGLVDAHGPAGTDSVPMQEQHDLPHLLAFLPCLRNSLSPPGPNPVHRLQRGRLCFDDIQHLGPKPFDQFSGQNRADPFHKSTGQVALHAFHRGWGHSLHHGGLELQSMFLVPDPVTFRRQPLSGTHCGQRSQNGYRFPMALDFHAQHGKPTLLVEERDPLHQPGKLFLQNSAWNNPGFHLLQSLCSRAPLHHGVALGDLSRDLNQNSTPLCKQLILHNLTCQQNLSPTDS